MGEADGFHVEVRDGVAGTTVGDALLVVWSSGATAARVRWVHERARELIERSPDGIVAAQFLLPSARPPGLGEVGAVRAGLRTVLPRSRRLVVVPLGDAAWQLVVRGVMRAGLALLGQSERIKVAPSAPGAVELLIEARSSSTPDGVTLHAAFDALVAELVEQPRARSS